MRLVCPKCEAKYEVPDDAIPDTGRDVQCANCGHAWFQMRARPAAAAEAVAAVTQPTPDPVADPLPQAVASLDAKPEGDAPKTEPAQTEAVLTEESSEDEDLPRTSPVEAEIRSEPEPETAPAANAGAPAEDEAGARKPAAYAVDDGVLAILREEAEREAIARRVEAIPLETQPGLGIDSAMPGAPPIAGAMSGTDTDAGAKPAARRDLLPDVEEINSTLRPSEVATDEAASAALAAEQDGRSGFRSGFLLVMALAILGAAVYIGAPRLSAAVPSLAKPLAAYVGAVDGLRLNLDGLMRSATIAINGE